MINLLAISYKNIGPFKGNPISIFFQQGKYLIKAPIGTGKSFLFFDGPIYGLYKYNTRSLLNNTSSEGNIKTLFSIENETRLIIRNISKSKIKESCSSILYKVSNYTPTKSNEIILPNQDIEDYLKNNGSELEKIEFKNETDLQQTLVSFLPLKEVFVNTVFLMQDSDNIFELIPSERLTVLKNVFGLLGIDEAKEIIAEKKKEINYKLKAYTDISKYNEKTQLLIKDLLINHKKIQEYNISFLEDNIKTKTDTLQEIDFIQDKITIQDLDINNLGLGINLEIDTIIKNKQDKYKTIKTQLENIIQSKKTQQIKIDSKRQNLIIIRKDNDELTKNIENINKNNFDFLKKQGEEKELQLQKINKTLPYQEINAFFIESGNNKELDSIENSNTIEGIESTYGLIKQLIEIGKSLQEKIKNNTLLIKNKELEQKNQEDKNNQFKKTLEDQLQEIKIQLQENEDHLKNFESTINEQAIFSCEKIQTNCPFIKIINKKTFDQLEEQKKTFIIKKERLLESYKEKEKQIKETQTIITQKPQEETEEYKSNIKTQEEATNIIKDFLTKINRKNIETSYQEYILIKKEKNSLEQIIKDAELQQKKKEEYTQTIIKNQEITKLIDNEIQESELEIKIFEEDGKQKEEEIRKIDFEKLYQIEKFNNQCITIQRDIGNLIQEYKAIQRETEILKKQEKQLTNLYNIFSKEILLLVLQDHLPILNDIINSYLSQIVEYQIILKLNKNNGEKLELEANIIDQEGEREIKSLSGGQKIILKLIWMLSISSYVRSPLLFLDETINNLDIDTVSKVADMLEDFVKQKNIKFYTVTHNQQIQDMQIRDKIIKIGNQ